MKLRALLLLLLLVATLALFGGLAGCQPAKTAVDVATAACEGETASVVVQRDKGGNVIQAVCAFEEEIAPIVQRLFEARKTGKKLAPPPN